MKYVFTTLAYFMDILSREKIVIISTLILRGLDNMPLTVTIIPFVVLLPLKCRKSQPPKKRMLGIILNIAA